MKAAFFYIALFAFAVLVVPMLALNYELELEPVEQVRVHVPLTPASGENQQNSSVGETSGVLEKNEVQSGEAQAQSQEMQERFYPNAGEGVASFRILDETSGEVTEVSLRDFVRGAVAAEMPVSFHPEALKAQAVAAHTFALHNRLVQQESPDPDMKGADFSADPSNLKVYVTEEQAKAFYGEKNADRYWEKVCAAADSVLDYVLEYENVPIVAAYHAISAGRTEDAANVWTGSAPYLAPADSKGDLLAPEFESSVSVSPEELREKLTAAYPDIELPEDPATWLGEAERSDSGYIVAIQAGGRQLHGKEIREMLGLRSHNFEVEYADGAFLFHVYGYGHGVGLSQYGADFLARQGYTFDEILTNYYTDVTLARLTLPDEVG